MVRVATPQPVAERRERPSLLVGVAIGLSLALAVIVVWGVILFLALEVY